MAFLLSSLTIPTKPTHWRHSWYCGYSYTQTHEKKIPEFKLYREWVSTILKISHQQNANVHHIVYSSFFARTIRIRYKFSLRWSSFSHSHSHSPSLFDSYRFCCWMPSAYIPWCHANNFETFQMYTLCMRYVIVFETKSGYGYCYVWAIIHMCMS